MTSPSTSNLRNKMIPLTAILTGTTAYVWYCYFVNPLNASQSFLDFYRYFVIIFTVGSIVITMLDYHRLKKEIVQ